MGKKKSKLTKQDKKQLFNIRSRIRTISILQSNNTGKDLDDELSLLLETEKKLLSRI